MLAEIAQMYFFVIHGNTCESDLLVGFLFILFILLQDVNQAVFNFHTRPLGYVRHVLFD